MIGVKYMIQKSLQPRRDRVQSVRDELDAVSNSSFDRAVMEAESLTRTIRNGRVQQQAQKLRVVSTK